MMAASEKDSARKLRVHKKSRRGCNSCRIRKVKCDETRPRCKKCATYNVVCSYDVLAKTTDLQTSVEGALNINIMQVSNVKAVLGTIAPPPPDARQFQKHDLELVHRFRTRTVPTITADHNRSFYQNEVVGLISSHPCLMHAILTITLMQDRQFSTPSSFKLTAPEAYHWQQATSIFNAKLSQPIVSTERDALWATAALLGIATFSHIEASTPSEAWPLKPPSSHDLNWLRMADGKKIVWKISQPKTLDATTLALRDDPLPPFQDPTFCNPKKCSFANLPPELITLCALTPPSTSKTNPYHSVAATISHCINSNNAYVTIMSFISFISNMDPSYKALLEQKDPRAMLLLAYCYGTICPYRLVWMWRRASLEGLAICTWLERYHWHDTNMMRAVGWPRRMCSS